MKEEITKYLKKAVLAQVDKCIDFKNEEFYKISKEQFLSGKIDPNITLKLFQKKKQECKQEKIENNKNTVDESIYVILAAKVFRTIVEGSQKKDNDTEDLTGLFFVPALLNKETSSLLPAIEDNKLPWFPREFLNPMIEPELAIGDSYEYDKVVSDEIYNIYSIDNWKEYMGYCKKIYEVTTKCKFDEDVILNTNGFKEQIPLESNVYIFLDQTINPTFSIRNLYSDIILQNRELPLYDNFISLSMNNTENLIQNTIENRIKHVGQMGGKYGLSPSQREGLNHFNKTEYGEILAIKGPPGTGKTTLIQSIVANKYVETALKEEEPEIIVAASTNNQAVTNIIESFGKIEKKFDNNLENRWIIGVNSFATYFPSKQKTKIAKAKGFQYANNRGDYFIANIDNGENIEESRDKFIKEATNLFGTVGESYQNNITIYKQKIHEKMCSIKNAQIKIVEAAENIEKIIGKNSVHQFIVDKGQEKEKLQLEKKNIKERVEFWRKQNSNLPIIWKILSWTKSYKSKISDRLKIDIDANENFEAKYLNLSIIENYYAKEIAKINEKLLEIDENFKKIKRYINNYDATIDIFKNCFVNASAIDSKLIIENEDLDAWLDTEVRYVMFWLAVHYYEARWLEGENELTPKQKGTNFDNVLIKLFKRLGLITPCLVMTFYMLPRQFEAFFDNRRGYLYEFIDNLIVDEAGQVTTEIAACSFALAKKALVVGDEKQIPPVWGIDRPLDKSLAIQEKVIRDEKEFKVLELYGITASNSSVMKVACKSCKYSKFDEKGLFLSEHRRCFDDIIQYCNELVYKGQLEPLRGNANKNGIESILPKMGYFQINSKKSTKVGTSRINTFEALQIGNWILKNYNKILDYYKKLDKNLKTENVLGIITPFKEQAREIKRIFSSMMPKEIKDKITIGTIHTFQGGERKIIIMSTTYGSDDGSFFIDNNKSLMNVAVSRAEDSFLMFGNIDCLKYEEKSPSGLLRRYIKNNEIKSEI